MTEIVPISKEIPKKITFDTAKGKEQQQKRRFSVVPLRASDKPAWSTTNTHKSNSLAAQRKENLESGERSGNIEEKL